MTKTTNAGQVVAVAYVTRWATTRGILVVRQARRSDSFPDCLRHGGALIQPSQWTTDRAEAETRYRAALMKAERAAFRKHVELVQAINAPPKYEGTP